MCLDSTHKTCMTSSKNWCYLYTLVCRCRVTGKGKPVAWMITNSESQYPIRFWLQWLKDAHGYQPSKVMIDNSNTEIAAINKAFNIPPEANGDDDSIIYNNNVKILICHWHLLKAWKKAILSKVVSSNPRSTSMGEKKEMRDKALQVLVSLVNAEDEITFDLQWEELELWCIENNDEWGTLCLFDYICSKYYEKRDKWSRCWRDV